MSLTEDVKARLIEIAIRRERQAHNMDRMATPSCVKNEISAEFEGNTLTVKLAITMDEAHWNDVYLREKQLDEVVSKRQKGKR